MADKIGIQQIRNDAHGERFLLVFIDGEKLAEQHGYTRQTHGPMTETEVRAFFEQGGQSPADVEAMFRVAREAFLKGSAG